MDSNVSDSDFALKTTSLSCVLNLTWPLYDHTDLTRASSEKDRNWACVAGDKSSKMENLLRTLLEEMSSMVGRAVFLCLKTNDLMNYELSLRITGFEGEARLAGMVKAFTMR